MLDETKEIPLYRQLKTILMEKIVSEEWKIGDRTPTEKELCEAYQVSRITVRMAMEELKKEGCLYRKQGQGTFVSRPKIEQQLSSFYSFSEDFARQGYRIESEALSFERVSCPAEEARMLEITPGEPVWRLRRLRRVNGAPFAAEISWLPFLSLEGLTREMIAENGLYHCVERLLGSRPDRATECFEAVTVHGEIRRLLGLPKGSPGLHIERVAMCGGRPVEFCDSVVRGDSIKYHISLR